MYVHITLLPQYEIDSNRVFMQKTDSLLDMCIKKKKRRKNILPLSLLIFFSFKISKLDLNRLDSGEYDIVYPRTLRNTSTQPISDG